MLYYSSSMVLIFNGEICMFVISYVARFTHFTSVTDFHEHVDAKKTFGCTCLSYFAQAARILATIRKFFKLIIVYVAIYTMGSMENGKYRTQFYYFTITCTLLILTRRLNK